MLFQIPSLCLLHLQLVFIHLSSFLRFLNNGTYVQIAVNAQGYCSSALKAYEIIGEHALKVAVADNISIFFTFLGVIGVTSLVAVSVYFTVQYLPYY